MHRYIANIYIYMIMVSTSFEVIQIIVSQKHTSTGLNTHIIIGLRPSNHNVLVASYFPFVDFIFSVLGKFIYLFFVSFVLDICSDLLI